MGSFRSGGGGFSAKGGPASGWGNRDDRQMFDAVCDNCGKPLKASQTAYFAFFEDRDIKAILCVTCKDESSQPEKPKAHENTSNQ